MDNKDYITPRKVLFVDDVEENLKSFKANFRRNFQVYTSSKPEAAIELIEKHNISVIVSDYKMPKIDGVTFLEWVKNEFPETTRIMLTGHADLPTVIDAINESGIFRMLLKPMNKDDVDNALTAAFKIQETKLELINRNKELKQLHSELDRLIFSTAHDLTGPLSNILGLVDLAKSDPENTNEYLKHIETSAKKLRIISRNAVSYHQNKRIEQQIQKVRLNSLISSVLKEFEFQPSYNRVKISINSNNQNSCYTDKTRLRFILNCLISNALNYQDNSKEINQIEIDTSVSQKQITIKVADNGVGMDLDTNSRYFDIYYRGHKQSTGSGIGLFIVKEAVNILGGTLHVQSKMDEGSTFEITLPNLLDKALIKQDN